MRRISSHLTYANVISTVCMFMLLGGGAYAAFHLPKNSVRSRNIRNGQVRGVDVKDDSLTGADIREAKLGQVPAAADAAVAEGIAPAEAFHEVDAPGEPAFQNGWKNTGGDNETAGFYKDREGVVHLKGRVYAGTNTIFQLPAGYRPAAGKVIVVPVGCNGCTANGGTVTLPAVSIAIDGTYGTSNDGAVAAGGNYNVGQINLDGVTFRAGS